MNQPGSLGMTALHEALASSSNQHKMVKLLLKNGAHTDVQDKFCKYNKL